MTPQEAIEIKRNCLGNKIELIIKAIRKECSSYSLVEWCESWGFTVEDFDKFLEFAERYNDLCE